MKCIQSQFLVQGIEFEKRDELSFCSFYSMYYHSEADISVGWVNYKMTKHQYLQSWENRNNYHQGEFRSGPSQGIIIYIWGHIEVPLKPLQFSGSINGSTIGINQSLRKASYTLTRKGVQEMFLSSSSDIGG